MIEPEPAAERAESPPAALVSFFSSSVSAKTMASHTPVQDFDPPPKPSVKPLQRDFYPSPSGSASVLLSTSWSTSQPSSAQHSNSHLPSLSSILGPSQPQRTHPSFSPSVSHHGSMASPQLSGSVTGGASVGAFLDRLGLGEYTQVSPLGPSAQPTIRFAFSMACPSARLGCGRSGSRRLARAELDFGSIGSAETIDRGHLIPSR